MYKVVDYPLAMAGSILASSMKVFQFPCKGLLISSLRVSQTELHEDGKLKGMKIPREDDSVGQHANGLGLDASLNAGLGKVVTADHDAHWKTNLGLVREADIPTYQFYQGLLFPYEKKARLEDPSSTIRRSLEFLGSHVEATNTRQVDSCERPSQNTS